MRIIKSFTLVILIGIAAVGMTITSARAGIEPSPFVEWGNAFVLRTSGGPVNPLVLVGFNPQPEPPLAQATVLDLLNPAAPMLTITDGVFEPDQPFRILFAMSGEGLFFDFPRATPDSFGHFEFLARDALGLALFNIMFDLTTLSSGVPDGSWVGFNPQPEPPFIPAGQGAFIGFDTGFTSFSTLTMTLQIQDIQGNDLSFAVIPLPAALPLFLTGLAGLAFIRRRQRRT